MTDVTPNVLVVDDDPVARAVLEGHLIGVGATVASVSSVDEALAHLAIERPDIVLCDVMMPERDGFDLVDAVRADDRLAGLPFVFVTAAGDRSARLRALEHGADELLSKPVDEVELAVRVRSLTQLARTRARLAGRERFVAVLDAVGEGILTVDAAGLIVDANETAVGLLGLPAGAEGQPLAPAIDGLELVRSRVDDGNQHDVLRRPPVGDGEDLYLAVARRSIDGAGAATQIVVVRDVTGDERSRYAGELVINSIVHKFRTPLTGLSGALELLGTTELTGPQRSLVGIVQSSAGRLDGAIRRVLEFADREATGRDASTVRLRPDETAILTTLVAEDLRPLVAAASVEVTGDVSVRADALGIALDELCANAVSSAGPDGVSVRITGGPEHVEVVVEDDGRGIPPEDTERVFQSFFQVDRTGQASGMGLGLPLVRHVVESLGGSVTAASIPSGPTRFRVTIPAAPVPVEDAVIVRAATPRG